MDARGWALVFRGADLRARVILHRAAEELAESAGAAGLLLHAEVYLAARAAYELDREGAMAAVWRQVEDAMAAGGPADDLALRGLS